MDGGSADFITWARRRLTPYTHEKMKIIFVDIIIFGSKVIFFKFLSYYIDYIVGSTLFFFYQNGPWGGRYHCSKDEH